MYYVYKFVEVRRIAEPKYLFVMRYGVRKQCTLVFFWSIRGINRLYEHNPQEKVEYHIGRIFPSVFECEHHL